MASTLDDQKFFLIDQFPGSVGDNIIPSPSSWTTYGTTEDFSIGTKRRIYDATSKGFAILTYLKVTGGTEGNANGMAVKSICGVKTSTAAAGTAGWAHTVTPDGGEALLNGPIAIALGTVSAANFTANTSYYGWFWTGGVCPVATITGLDGNYATDENVAAGSGMDMVDNSGPIAFGIVAAADVGIVSAFAGAADA